jgi:hypothetical protein
MHCALSVDSLHTLYIGIFGTHTFPLIIDGLSPSGKIALIQRSDTDKRGDVPFFDQPFEYDGSFPEGVVHLLQTTHHQITKNGGILSSGDEEIEVTEERDWIRTSPWFHYLMQRMF